MRAGRKTLFIDSIFDGGRVLLFFIVCIVPVRFNLAPAIKGLFWYALRLLVYSRADAQKDDSAGDGERNHSGSRSSKVLEICYSKNSRVSDVLARIVFGIHSSRVRVHAPAATFRGL